MAWVDLFQKFFEPAQPLDLGIYTAMYQSSYNEGPVIDPGTSEVLMSYCGSDLMYYAENSDPESGNFGCVEYVQTFWGGTEGRWDYPRTHFFANGVSPGGAVASPFVGMRVRVRMRFIGDRNTNEDPNAWSVDGAGCAGLVWEDGEGTAHVDDRIGRFNSLTAWGFDNAISDWSSWFEYTFTGDEEHMGYTYLGFGHSSEYVSGSWGPPRALMIVQWQVWEEGDGPDPEPEPEPEERSLPWWYCVPKTPPIPCAVRPTGFIPFADYDVGFKYPIASSRVPCKLLTQGCIACGPTLVIPTDPVDPGLG